MTDHQAAQDDVDVIDRAAGLAAHSPTHALRRQRAKVVDATQGSYDALFDPALPGLPLAERLLVALYAARLTPAPALVAHYAERLAAAGGSPAWAALATAGRPEDLGNTPDDVRLRAMLVFTRTLIENPVAADRAALETLPAAGLATADVVTLAQLIAFLSYQVRLVAGLNALQTLNNEEASA